MLLFEKETSEIFQDLQSALDHLRAARNRLSAIEYDNGRTELEVVNLIDILNAVIPYGRGDLSCLESLARRVESGETEDWVYGEERSCGTKSV